MPHANRLVIVTACYGSRGDVAPLASLARAIQTSTKASDDDESTTAVVFMANPHFKSLAHGLDFHPFGDAEEYESRLADSKGRKHYGEGSIVDWWMRHLGRHVRAMRALMDDETKLTSVVIVGHPLVRFLPRRLHSLTITSTDRTRPPHPTGPRREEHRGPRQRRPPRPARSRLSIPR